MHSTCQGCVEELGLAVLELLLVMNGNLLLNHHLLLQVNLLLLLDQGVWLNLCIRGYTNTEPEKKSTQRLATAQLGTKKKKRQATTTLV